MAADETAKCTFYVAVKSKTTLGFQMNRVLGIATTHVITAVTEQNKNRAEIFKKKTRSVLKMHMEHKTKLLNCLKLENYMSAWLSLRKKQNYILYRSNSKFSTRIR